VAKYVLRERERVTWTTTTIKGPRRVSRWSPWRTLSRHVDAEKAEVAFDERRAGLADRAVFMHGRRLTIEQLRRAAEEVRRGG
jgi:hypothetical protein